MLIVGLMSGTAADGVDAALVEVNRVDGRLRIETRAVHTLVYSAEVRQDILRSTDPATGTVDRICHLNAQIGEWFAQAALQVVADADCVATDIDLIASHGQTIWHAAQPDRDPPSTLQIGEPAVIAERTGRTVVAGFRTRDVAAGGQGAPLISFVDYALFADAAKTRAIQNIGGIANVTVLPAGGGPEAVFAFDTGPGNAVLDALAKLLFDQEYDDDGRIAAVGRVDWALLTELLEDPYFKLPPPKTTGREHFGRSYATEVRDRGLARGLTPADVLATATRLTARSIAESYRRFVPPVDEVIVSGGGRRNSILLAGLAEELTALGWLVGLRRPEEFGIDSDAKEAIGFAILGYETIHGRVGTLPRCTGARHPVVLGSIVPGDNYLALVRSVNFEAGEAIIAPIEDSGEGERSRAGG